MVSVNLTEKITSCITESSYRATAKTITDTSGQNINRGGVWNLVQRIGERVREEARMVKEMKTDTLKPEK